MNPDLRERLRRLGVHKGVANLKPSRPSPGDRDNLPEPAVLYNGNVNSLIQRASLEPVRTPFGQTYVRRAHYVLSHRHGDRALDGALLHSPELLAKLIGRRADAVIDLRDALFLDTETTGLAGGAGTLVFLVGLGYFDGEGFVIEQFFLRDPVEETAMLCEIDRRVGQRGCLVTFNGQVFDVPLLESRFTLSRLAPSFGDKAHLDLLLPARRVWRGTLDSCSLGSLEFHLLGVQREQRDVPGSVIPFLYREYLASGGGDLNEDMQRVMYHNLNDILSMVTLVSRLMDALTQPNNASEHFAAARTYERLGEWEAAERVYRSALEGAMTDDSSRNNRHESSIINPTGTFSHSSSALRHLARFLKRRGKPSEAFVQWQRLAEGNDGEGLIELAKHYEWRECDLSQALLLARRALRVSTDSALREAIEHRIARLERKIKTHPEGLQEL